jgi:hypothetical protein
MSEPSPLPTPELQFIDANGVPFSGGTLALYAPGTTTPKDSWMDYQGTVLNANPITLDAAGRCIIWGDGDYRCILSDADGNLIFDQISTTLVSAAMVPVVSAPTIAEAVRLLGIQDMVDTETTRALAAEAALGTRIDDTNTALTAETNRAEAAETTLQNNLNAEISRAEAAEAHLQSEIDGTATAVAGTTRQGTITTNPSGYVTVVYTTPFPNATDQYFTQVTAITSLNTTDTTQVGFVYVHNVTRTGFDALIVDSPQSNNLASLEGTFNYLCYGH